MEPSIRVQGDGGRAPRSAALGYGKAAGCDGRELLNQDSQGERAGAWRHGVSFTGTYSATCFRHLDAASFSQEFICGLICCRG